MFIIDPIGYFHTSVSAPYDLPRQPGLLVGNRGYIELKRESQFEQALEGLEGFDLIWVVFRFHGASHWKPKVLPPRGGKKRGVFSTRSPHRPNFIGFSCVKLESIEKRRLFIANHDLIDRTPILDLKPYLNYADSLTSERQGWLDELTPATEVVFEWSMRAQQQIDYLKEVWNYPLKGAIQHRLSLSPTPYPNHRVRKLADHHYELAYRTWRIHYTWQSGLLSVLSLRSGYDPDTLAGKKTSRWDDVSMHQAFVRQWPSEEKNHFDAN